MRKESGKKRILIFWVLMKIEPYSLLLSIDPLSIKPPRVRELQPYPLGYAWGKSKSLILLSSPSDHGTQLRLCSVSSREVLRQLSPRVVWKQSQKFTEREVTIFHWGLMDLSLQIEENAVFTTWTWGWGQDEWPRSFSDCQGGCRPMKRLWG